MVKFQIRSEGCRVGRAVSPIRFFDPILNNALALRASHNNKQIRNIVRFFSRISGGPGDGPQIVRFFPGFPEVQGRVRRL